MEVLANLFAGIITIPVFIPFAAFIAVYFLFLLWKKSSKKESLNWAANVTTFFLIVAVLLMHGLIKSEEAISAMWWIIAFFLCTGGLIGWLQYKVKGKFDPPKMLRAVWRLAFVIFSVAYFILFFSSINYFLNLT
ncbi:DUF3397 family protein [Ammoniphilus sp. CFH 90114]|uniref:DUF3397 family protein n=1 Tax=Ammoniphilus sp. CFH 90114 TaxID=2493665 RepID=UPI00100DFFB6|nr:DUF3397 family protein [Ammoniphilus sp. CFH 90114]RXT14993.1 DUF3397 family protein [Ammoniphilus sp. CFH 90114]